MLGRKRSTEERSLIKARKDKRWRSRTRTKRRTTDELATVLKSMHNINAQGTYKNVSGIAIRMNVPLEHEVPVFIPTWVGKPKGAFQILYERGFVDPSNVPKYKFHIKDADSEEKDLYCLMTLLSKQTILENSVFPL